MTKVPRRHQLTRGLSPVFILSEHSAWPTQQGHVDRTVSYCLLFLLLNPHAYWFWEFFILERRQMPVSVFEVSQWYLKLQIMTVVQLQLILLGQLCQWHQLLLFMVNLLAIEGERIVPVFLVIKVMNFRGKKNIYIFHTQQLAFKFSSWDRKV